MLKIKIRKLTYQLRHRVLTLNNAVIAVAFLIAIGWVWGSLGVMQRNYDLQRTLDRREQELRREELRVRTLELEGRYYQTDEYLELAARQRLGIAQPDEHALILPPNSEEARTENLHEPQTRRVSDNEQPSNFQQWLDFLLGVQQRDIDTEE